MEMSEEIKMLIDGVAKIAEYSGVPIANVLGTLADELISSKLDITADDVAKKIKEITEK